MGVPASIALQEPGSGAVLPELQIASQSILNEVPLRILRQDPSLGPIRAQIEACRYFTSACKYGDECGSRHLVDGSFEEINAECRVLAPETRQVVGN